MSDQSNFFTFGQAANVQISTTPSHLNIYTTGTTTGTGGFTWAGWPEPEPEPAVPAGRTVVVVAVADLDRMSDTEIWCFLEDDLAVEADEIYIRRTPGRYRVIKPMIDAGTEILSSEEQRAELEAIHRRLKGEP